MTDQTSNGLHYDGEGYAIMCAEPGIFSPWDHGIEPEDICTSNWAGYVCLFEVRNDHLYLNYLTVAHTPRRGPPPKEDPDNPLSMLVAGSPPLPLLNGVKAQKGSMGYWDYLDVDLKLDYTGTITVANGDEPPQTSYEPEWSFETVVNQDPPQTAQYLALTFEHGKLMTAIPVDPPPSEDYFEL